MMVRSVRAVQAKLPSRTGNPAPAMALACILIAGAGLLNFGGTLVTVSRLPVPDALPPALSLLGRFGVDTSLYAKAVAAIDIAYALVVLGVALLLAETLKDRRRWARIAAAVLALAALCYALAAGTGLQLTAAALAAAGTGITFTKGVAPWFRRREPQPLQADPV